MEDFKNINEKVDEEYTVENVKTIAEESTSEDSETNSLLDEEVKNTTNINSSGRGNDITINNEENIKTFQRRLKQEKQNETMNLKFQDTFQELEESRNKVQWQAAVNEDLVAHKKNNNTTKMSNIFLDIESTKITVKNNSIKSKLKDLPWENISEISSLVLLAFVLWAIAYSLFGEDVGVDSQMFSLLVRLCGKIAGVLVGLIKIPPMLGMLAVGVLVKNIGFVNLTDDYKSFAAVLRQMALVNILLPAGLGLDPGALRKVSGMVLCLALVPAAVEVGIMTLTSHFLMDLPWLWAVLLGLLMGAVSPAVIIPCLFELQDLGYGVNKGIHTLVIAASTLDDIACIAVFGIIIGIIFSTGSLTMQLLEGPIVIALGFAYGICFGIVAQYLPHPKADYLVTLRTLVIGAGSVLAAVGSQAIGYGGAGTLGCIVSAFVACLSWRKQGWNNFNPVKENFSLLWKFFEPISFALIGMEVDFSVLETDVVLWGSLCMIIALLIRMLASVAITIRSHLNLKETIFVAFSTIPKATVQAALGPVALDYARNQESEEIKNYANIMLIIAVLSIIITSPIGAVLIMQGGPRLLHQTLPEKTGIINPAIDEDKNIDSISFSTTKRKHSNYNTI